MKSRLFDLAQSQNWRCCYCGVRFADSGPSKATEDHVQARGKGGCNLKHNIVAACYRCNNLRGDQNAYAFFESRRWERQTRKEWGLMPAGYAPTIPRATLGMLWPK